METGAMQYIKNQAYKNHLQLVPSRLLEFRDSQTGDIFVGYVVATTSNSIIIRDRKDNISELMTGKRIDLDSFSVGDLINAYGQRVNGTTTVNSVEIIK